VSATAAAGAASSEKTKAKTSDTDAAVELTREQLFDKTTAGEKKRDRERERRKGLI
jgi:hypothetical protein